MEHDRNEGLLLTTKLAIPPAYCEHVISRSRLYHDLATGLKGPLTLIMAPAGFGKTTLVGEWLRQQNVPVAWVSLESSDNNPVRFWRYVLTALQRLTPAIEELPEMVYTSPHAFDYETLLVALINACATLEQDSILVLDDYHTIYEPAIHQSIHFLLEHLPSRLHLCLLTREVLPISIARFRVQGKVIELSAAQLRFTSEETELFLTQSMGISLQATELATIYQRTEGWVAGLQLLALSLHGLETLEEQQHIIQTFSGTQRHIHQYIKDEVIDRLPADVQEFLLTTSVLERLQADVCNAVTGRYNAHEMLGRLISTQLFLHPLDEDGKWYRYTRLFRELLIYQLQYQHPGLKSELHQRAAVWYEQQGLLIDAIKHLVEADHIEQMADLIEHHGRDYIRQGNETMLYRWLLYLPETAFATRPMLSYLQASFLFLSGNSIEAEQALVQAEQLWLEKKEPLAQIDVLYLRALWSLLREDGVRALAYVQQACALTDRTNVYLHSQLRVLEGSCYVRQGDLEQAEPILAEGHQMAQVCGNRAAQMIGSLSQARLVWQRGDLHAALQEYRRLIHFVGKGRIWYTINAHTHMAQIYREWDETDQAEDHWQQALQIGIQDNFEGGVIYERQMVGALLAWQQGKHEAVLTWLDQATWQLQRFGPNRVALAQLAGLRIQFLLAQGDEEAALACYQEYLQVAESLPLLGESSPFEQELCAIMQARLAIAQEQKGIALPLLERALTLARQQGRVHSQILLLVVLTLAHHAEGHTLQTLQLLQQALHLAEPGGYIRIFADEGPVMAVLLSEFGNRYQRRNGGEHHSISPAYLQRLLSALGQDVPPFRRILEERRETQPGTLSEREQAVLNLIAQGLSNQEIARALVVTVSTVKTHLNNIYAKLHVHTRLQAVTRAYDLGLLSRQGMEPEPLTKLKSFPGS